MSHAPTRVSKWILIVRVHNHMKYSFLSMKKTSCSDMQLIEANFSKIYMYFFSL